MDIRYLTQDDITPKSPRDWLWCLYCFRFFQAKDLRWDGRDRQGCALCNAAGLGVAIYPWDTWRHETWPKSTAELHHGMLCR